MQAVVAGKATSKTNHNGKDAYQNAKERAATLLKMLTFGDVEIVAPGGYVVDRETANPFAHN